MQRAVRRWRRRRTSLAVAVLVLAQQGWVYSEVAALGDCVLAR